MRRPLPFVLLLATAAPALSAPPVEPRTRPPAAVARPVTDDYFGTKVTDDYRYMEARDAETVAWMKAQGRFTRALFDSIGPRAAYLKAIDGFGGGFGLISATGLAGDRLFYLERAPGSDVFALKVRGPDGSTRMLVDTAALIKASGGTPHAIDYFAPAPDGSKVAVGISTGGSEASELSVVDAATGRTIAGPIDRAQWGGVQWTDDGAGLTFSRLQKLGPNAPGTDKYKNITADYWDLTGDTVPLVGRTIGKGPVTLPDRSPFILLPPHADHALLAESNGVQNELPLWWSSKVAALSGKARWVPLATAGDGITNAAVNRTTLFLLSHKDAPTFKVLALPLGAPLAQAKEVVPVDPKRLVESIHAASDGLYVAVREGLWSKLIRVTPDGRTQQIALPIRGSIGEVSTDPDRPGAIVAMDSWIDPAAHWRYDPASAAFVALSLDTHPAYDAKRYAATELMARAKDGTMVPLSVISPAGKVVPRPLLLDAYGAYGIPIFPAFGTRVKPFLDAGGTRAECHVRGGGELGEAWRLGGKGATKPNTWNDAIACAETLIAKGYTTRAMLTIMGTSAGGIMVGRATTERPDLFAGAVARVGDVNALRMETMPAGPANIPEFGTVKDRQGFADLSAMDVIHHVRPGVRYPAFLITGGLNDPRVEPWQGAKLAATLQAVPGNRPALFRLEEQAGHGLGTTRSTRDAEEADIAAFVFWRAGVPAWQPGP